MQTHKLTGAQRENELASMIKHGWLLVNDYYGSVEAISKVFEFENFNMAFRFMCSIATQAEKYDHHPDWKNIYNKVTITWSTHDCNGLSLKDIQMARICDELNK